MTLAEKVTQLGNNATATSFVHGVSEALHGVSNAGTGTLTALFLLQLAFPLLILTSASFNEALWKSNWGGKKVVCFPR